MHINNKTLRRARDPRANGTWLSKLLDRELIRRARMDGREARGNEKREKRKD